jgi:hypothetical protein
MRHGRQRQPRRRRSACRPGAGGWASCRGGWLAGGGTRTGRSPGQAWGRGRPLPPHQDPLPCGGIRTGACCQRERGHQSAANQPVTRRPDSVRGPARRVRHARLRSRASPAPERWRGAGEATAQPGSAKAKRGHQVPRPLSSRSPSPLLASLSRARTRHCCSRSSGPGGSGRDERASGTTKTAADADAGRRRRRRHPRSRARAKCCAPGHARTPPLRLPLPRVPGRRGRGCCVSGRAGRSPRRASKTPSKQRWRSRVRSPRAWHPSHRPT